MILNRQRTVRVARPPLELFLRRVREQLGLGSADVAICLVTDVLSFPAVTRRKPVPLPNRNGHVAAAFRGGRRSTISAARKVDRHVLQEGAASGPEANFLGDIAISPATARRNAKKCNRTLPSELQILILHGVLHLLGYDHETDRGQMTRIEHRLRRKLGLS
jgi:rRNA maturation RNase YbeY